MRLAKRKRTYWIMLLAVFTGMVLAAAAAQGAAHAQEPPPPHDLSLRYRHGLSSANDYIGWIFVLTNQGGQHAHSGQVKLSFTPYVGDPDIVLEVASGGTEMGLDPDHGRFDPATNIWHFRNLPPGHTAELQLHDSLSNQAPPGTPGRDLVKGRGEIISSVPEEDPMFLYNNATREAWRHVGPGNDDAAEGDAVVEMRVGDRFPQANDTVDFTVSFYGARGYIGSLYEKHDMYEVRVKVSPSPGLELVSAAAPNRTYDFGTSTTSDDVQISSSFDLSTGIWNLGTVAEFRFREFIDMPVKVRYTGAVPLDEACLTAELVNVVPPERPLDDLGFGAPDTQGNNKARACLGDDLTVTLLTEGNLDHFTLYPCFGVSAYPCNAQDTVEFVSILIGSSGEERIFQPENIVLQVEDT